MSSFDLNQFLQKRSLIPVTKTDEVLRATAEKTAQLQEAAARKRAETESLSGQSWSSKLGLEDSAAGKAVNLGASIVSGTARLAGDLASLPVDAAASFLQSDLSQQQLDAYSRSAKGQALPGDAELLNTPLQHMGGKTASQVMADVNSVRKAASSIDSFSDVSSIVDKRGQEKMVAQLKQGFNDPWEQVKKGWAGLSSDDKLSAVGDISKGLGSLILRAGEAAIDNPMAATEFIAENAPQLLMGTVGKAGRAALTVSNLGYGLENYRKGIENYQAANNGALPSEEERIKMAGWAAASVLAEELGDASILKAFKGADEAVSTVAPKGLMKNLAIGARKVMGGTASEALTEGFQTYAEGEAALKPASAEDVYVGAAIGGMAGGGLTSFGAVPEALANGFTSDGTRQKQVEAAQAKAHAAKVDQAVKAGNVDDLATPGSKNYDPSAAVSALHKMGMAEGKDPMARVQDFIKATTVNLQAQKDLEAANDALEAAVKAGDPEVIAELTAKRDQAEKVKDTISEQLVAFNQDIQRANGSPKEQVAAATAPDAKPEVVEMAVNLAMASPDALSKEDLQALLSGASLSAEQKNVLRSLAAAKVAQNRLKKLSNVVSDVMDGNKAQGYLGIHDYQRNFAAAHAAGNQALMDKQLGMLSKFNADHQAKAKAIGKVFSQIEAGKVGRDGMIVARLKDGGWELRPAPVGVSTDAAMAQELRAELRKSGSLHIHPGSGKVRDQIKDEAQVLKQTLAALTAARKLKPSVATAPAASPAPAPKAEAKKPAAPAPAPTPAPAPQPKAEEEKPEPAPVAAAPAAPAAAPVQAQETQKEEPASTEPAVAEPQAEATEAPVEAVVQEEAQEAAQPVEAPVQEEAVVEEAASESAALDVMAEKQDDPAVPYHKRNAVADFMVQSAKHKLSTVKNFLSKLRNGQFPAASLITATTPEGKKTQQEALRSFFSFTKEISPHLLATAYSRGSDYRYQNPMELLVQSQDLDGKEGFTLEQNIQTAMAYAGYSLVNSIATMGALNDADDIRAILGRDENYDLSPEAQGEFFDKVRLNVMANRVGRIAVQALGLKAKKNAPKDLMARLENSMGMSVLYSLKSMGLVVIDEMSNEKFESLGGVVQNTKANTQTFVQPAKDSKGQLRPLVTMVREANKGSASFLDSVFGTEATVSWPSLEAPSFVQRFTKGTRQLVSRSQAKIMEHENGRARKFNPHMLALLEQYDEAGEQDLLLEMAGGQPESSEFTFEINRKSQEAKNLSLRSELDRLKEFKQILLEAKFSADDLKGLDNFSRLQALSNIPFFFQHVVWKTQRVGIDTNGINPQTSKIHRHVMYQESWKTDIKLSDPAALGSFKLRVMEAMGVKTERQLNAQSLLAFDSMFDPSSQEHKDEKARDKAAARLAAVEALIAFNENGSMSPEQRDAVRYGVSVGGENFQSLSALSAMAAYVAAQRTGQPDASFTTYLMGEIDGVTNGPMLSHLLLGAASSAKKLFQRLNRGGFFSLEDADKHTHYGSFRGAKGAMDLYENTTAAMMRVIEGMRKEEPKLAKSFDAVEVFTGALQNAGGVTKDGRNIIKTPLTGFHFGSSLASAADGMANYFFDQVLKKFEDLAKKEQGDGQSPETKEAIAALNYLLFNPRGERLAIPEGMSAAELVKRSRTDSKGHKHLLARQDFIDAIKANFVRSVGKAMKTTFESQFADFIEVRDQLNRAAELSYTLYNSVLINERNKFLTELVKAGEIPVNGAGNPVGDLSSEQLAAFEKRIAKAIPIMATLMANRSGELGAGMKMAKTKLGVLSKEQSPLYHQDVRLPDGSKRGYFYKAGQAEQEVQESPGVAMVVTGVHSMDSAISHYAAALGDVLNIHDAHGAGIANFYETGRNLNEQTFKALLEYSPGREIYNGLARTVMGVAPLISGGMSEQSLSELKESLLEQSLRAAKISKKDIAAQKADKEGWQMMLDSFSIQEFLETQLTVTLEKVNRADRVKLEALSQMAFVDQYALEGGQYVVTDSDRQAAQDLLAALVGDVSPAILDAIKAVASATPTQNEGQVPAQPQAADMNAEEIFEEEDALDQGKFHSTLHPAEVLPILEQISTAGEGGLQAPAKAVQEALATNPELTLEEALRNAPAQARTGLLTAIVDAREELPNEAWNALGTSVVESDAALVAEFEKRGSMTAEQAFNWLDAYFGKSGQEFNKQLVAQTRKLVAAGLNIRYVTRETDPGLLIAAPLTKSRGWYAADGRGKREIYVLSPEHVYSGLTPETLLHELVHAAVSNTIANAQQNPNAPALDKAYVAELEVLRGKVVEMLEANPELKSKFAATVANVDELVAWGMTNRDFQVEVLAKVEMKSTTKAKENGAAAFIKALVGLIFKGITKDRQNGLGVLLSNVGGLYHETAKRKSTVEAAINLSQANDPMAKVGKWTTMQIYEALGTNRDHAELLDMIVHKVHGAFGYFKSNMQAGQALSPLDVWVKAKATGEAPFVSSIVGRVPMDEQNAFVIEQVEATVRTALEDSESHTSVAYAELVKLYREVREKLTVKDFHPGDWDTASPQEQAAAKAFHDLVFEIKAGADGRSEYLSRFVAMGLAYPPFNKILSQASDRFVVSRSARTYGEAIAWAFKKVLTWFSMKHLGAKPGEPMNATLRKVTDRLVDIEARKRRVLAAGPGLSMFRTAEEGLTSGVQAARAAINAAAKSPLVTSSKVAAVRLAGEAVQAVQGGYVGMVMDQIFKIRDDNIQQVHGVAMGMLNYMKGPSQLMLALLREAKHFEKKRKDLMTDVSKGVRSAFKGYDKLDEAVKTSLTRALLRTGAHVLLDTEGMTGLDALLDSHKARKEAIAKRVELLEEFKEQAYYVTQAKALAWFKVSGKPSHGVVMMNAHNIARLAGSSKQKRVSETQAKVAERIIDELASLYAIDYLNESDRANTKEVLRKEAARPQSEGSGLEMMLRLHAQLDKESSERNFGGKRALMMKGFTPEIVNPHTALATARSDAERMELEAAGYTLAYEVPQDPADPNKAVVTLHVLKDGGLPPHLTGTLAYDGKSSRGTTVYGNDDFFSAEGLQNMSDNAKITQARRAELDRMIDNSSLGWDPRAVKTAHMVPIMSEEGNIAGWRYMMIEESRDILLERNNRPDEILGALAGSIVGKETADQQNRKVVQALRDLYKEDYASRPKSYATISPNSSDPAMREMYRLLPDDTQQAIREIWGADSMRVPYDLLDVTFGYRKLSLANSFEKKARIQRLERLGLNSRESLNFAEEILVDYTESLLCTVAKARGMDHAKAEIYARRGAVVIRRAERVWLELVREIKDIIVVKSGLVLLGNIKSNLSLLAIQGVSMKDMLHHHRVALRGAMDYQRDRAALAQVELLLNSGFTRGDEDKLQAEAAVLRDAIARNPVRELIDAGMMPTIVEDVAAEEDLYSYKSQLARKVDGLAKRTPEAVKTVGRYVFMTHDTPLYRTLSQATQLSDFVARYTLYQHLISRKEDPLSKEDAIHEAGEAFVNYDVPMHRSVQYLDDMGVLPFTKYFLSIQRVLLKMGREQPARALLALLAGNYFNGLDLVTESAMITRIGNNPLGMGALQPDVLGELATTNAALTLIK